MDLKSLRDRTAGGQGPGSPHRHRARLGSPKATPTCQPPALSCLGEDTYQLCPSRPCSASRGRSCDGPSSARQGHRAPLGTGGGGGRHMGVRVACGLCGQCESTGSRFKIKSSLFQWAAPDPRVSFPGRGCWAPPGCPVTFLGRDPGHHCPRPLLQLLDRACACGCWCFKWHLLPNACTSQSRLAGRGPPLL